MPLKDVGNAVSSGVNAGGGILRSIWNGVRFIAPILAVSTFLAAATGGLSLTAQGVAAAGSSVAATGAVPVTAANLASFTWQGLIHNAHGFVNLLSSGGTHLSAMTAGMG